MILRYAYVSFLNACASLFGMVMVLAYVVPDALPTMALTVIGWIIGFLITLACTGWAFSGAMPTKKDALILAAFHAIFFLIVYAGFGTVFSDQGAYVAVSAPVLGQAALEIAAVFFSAYYLRRRRLQSVLGEGRAL